MRLTGLRRRYLRAYYRDYSDGQLAKALGVQREDIVEARETLGLARTQDEDKCLKSRANELAPTFDGMLPRPQQRYAIGKNDILLAVATGLLSFIVYVRTLGPTVTGEDAGELVTAAYTLGVAHPPGYPLWCLLGKLFTFLPFGTVAWRVNLMSAFFASLTVALTCLLALRVTYSRLASVTGALAFAFSAEFWSQSVIAEVYTLNSFFVALCLLLLLVWYETRNQRYLIAFAFVYGLGLTNHNTTHLLGPLYLVFVFFIDREPWRRWKLYGTCLVVSLIPLSLFAYLPIRAVANPPVNWGDPKTLENFWEVVSRKQYAFGFVKNPRSLGRLAMDTWAFFELYGGEFTPWLCWVPAVGIVALWKRNRFVCVSLLSLFLYLVFGFIVLLNFDVDRESLWLNNVFWIPAYMVAAIFLGAALVPIANPRVNRYVARGVGGIAAGVCFVIPLFVNYHANDKSDYYFAYDFGVNALKTLDKDAIYFPSADHATFPALYLQAVEGMRPDVSIANKYGYPEERLYRDMPEDQRKGFRKIPTDDQEAEIEDWIITHTSRPVYFSRKRSFPNLPDRKLVNEGLLYRVVMADENRPSRDWWADYQWKTTDPAHTRGDLTAEFVLSDYQYARGRDYLANGDKEKGLEKLRLSLRISGDTKEALNNVGSLCAETGLLDEAMEFFARTLKVDPEYDFALRNLAKVYLQMEKYEQAMPLFERLLKKSPGDAEGIILLSKCLTQMGRVQDALGRLQFLAQIYPKDPRAFREMGFIYMNNLGDQQAAQRMFARSLTLDPNQPDIADLVQIGGKPSTQKAGLLDDSLKDLMPELPNIPGIEKQMPQLPQPNVPKVPNSR